MLFSDARSTALGCHYSTLTGYWSSFSNPAGIASEKSTGFGLFYGNFYGLAETSTGAAVLSVTARPGNLAIGFASSGFSSINESRATLTYARHIGKKFRAGMAINWLYYNQPYDYRDLYAWIPVLGIQWIPNEHWTIGAFTLNPANQQYLPHGYRNIASGLTAGAGFMPSEEFHLMLELQKISGENARYAFGVETCLLKSLIMRFGISRQYIFSYYAGAGFVKNKTALNISLSHHTVLGFSPGLDLNFKF